VIGFSFSGSFDVKDNKAVKIIAVDLRFHVVKTLFAATVKPRVLVVRKAIAKARPTHTVHRPTL
jgi:hypothetical protein